tara:strand:- start:52 stop:336 length:285 start_codon:yes stop_codon:yes gene_type:complete
VNYFKKLDGYQRIYVLITIGWLLHFINTTYNSWFVDIYPAKDFLSFVIFLNEHNELLEYIFLNFIYLLIPIPFYFFYKFVIVAPIKWIIRGFSK